MGNINLHIKKINELKIAQMENIHMQASYSKAVENQ